MPREFASTLMELSSQEHLAAVPASSDTRNDRGMARWPLWAKGAIGLAMILALLPAMAVGSVLAVAAGTLLLGWEAAQAVRRAGQLKPALVRHSRRDDR